MKKGDIAIQYVFLILIGVVAVFVIVGMLANWSLSTNKFMDVLTGGNGKTKLQDKETIRANSVESFRNEIIKHAKICFENKRRDAGESGELCYTVKCCTNTSCATTCRTSCDGPMNKSIEKSIGNGTVRCSEFMNSDKAIIEYDFLKNMVIIR